MEVIEVSGGVKPLINGGVERLNSERDQVRVKRKTLEAVLDQCQRALELLSNTGCIEDNDDDVIDVDDSTGPSTGRRGSPPQPPDGEADLSAQVESPDFLEKLETCQVHQNYLDLSPKQLQDALSSMKKKKGKHGMEAKLSIMLLLGASEYIKTQQFSGLLLLHSGLHAM